MQWLRRYVTSRRPWNRDRGSTTRTYVRKVQKSKHHEDKMNRDIRTIDTKARETEEMLADISATWNMKRWNPHSTTSGSKLPPGATLEITKLRPVQLGSCANPSYANPSWDRTRVESTTGYTEIIGPCSAAACGREIRTKRSWNLEQACPTRASSCGSRLAAF